MIVAVAVNAVGAIRFDPPLRSTQQRLTQERHHGRAVQILMRASGGAPGILVTGAAKGLRWMFLDLVQRDGHTATIGFGLYDEVRDTSFGAMRRVAKEVLP